MMCLLAFLVAAFYLSMAGGARQLKLSSTEAFSDSFHFEPSFHSGCQEGSFLDLKACRQAFRQLRAHWHNKPFEHFEVFRGAHRRVSGCTMRVDTRGWRMYYNLNLKTMYAHNLSMRVCSKSWKDQTNFFEMSRAGGSCEKDVAMTHTMCLTSGVQLLIKHNIRSLHYHSFGEPLSNVSNAPRGCNIRNSDKAIVFNPNKGRRSASFSAVCGQHPWGVASPSAALASIAQNATLSHGAMQGSSQCDPLAWMMCCPGCGKVDCKHRRRIARMGCSWFRDLACCGSGCKCRK